MRRTALIIALLALFACGDSQSTNGTGESSSGSAGEQKTSPPSQQKPGEPDYITIAYLRVGFEGLPGDQEITRSQDDALERANAAHQRIQKGEDFDAVAKEISDDDPRVYRIANESATPKAGYLMRAGVVRALGDVGFGLKPGESALAGYHEKECPHGYFVIKRTE